MLEVFESYCLHAMDSARSATSSTVISSATRRPSATARTRWRSAKRGAVPRSRRCCETPSTPATTSGAATTSAAGDPSSDPVKSGSGVPRRHMSRWSRRSATKWSRSVPAGTSSASKSRRSVIASATVAAPGRLYVLRGRVHCALCDRRMDAATRRARSVTAAASAPAAAASPPTSPATRAPCRSRRS